MINTVSIIWHDLREDPNDLPEEDGCYWCVEKNRYTDKVCYFDYCSMDCIFAYDKKGRIWSFSWEDDYGDYGGSGYHESIGIERNLKVTEEEDWQLYRLLRDGYSDEFVVIAWAEIPEDWPGRKECG